MSITKRSTNSVEDDVDGEEEDFVNISFLEEEEEKVEDTRVDFSRAVGDAVDGNLDERKPAAVAFPSIRTQNRDGDNGNNLTASVDTADGVDFEDDRKPAAAVAPSPSGSQSKDARFMCAICIDEVSDEPVVTRCGHIFCWPCLYQWLAPGMLVNEYYAAFGGGGGMGIGRATSRGNLNNFISEMATHSSNHHDRPYDTSRFNRARRVCPVCKAFCSVDSVIPIYIHVHANGASQADRQGDVTAQSLSQEEQSQHEEQHSDNNGGGDDNIIHSDESPLFPHSFDPTAANIGIRQRRPLTASTSNVSSINNAPESPQSTQHMYENIPSNATSTPVIRNGGGDNIAVPNRPFPTPTPSFTNNNNSNIESTTSQHHHRGQYEDQTMAAAPVLNTSTVTSSSSFRLAYRPRHVDYSQSIQFQNRQMGGLMGIVSGLVHSIDNIGAANPQSSSQGTTRDQSDVPQIHRSDNGLGGIGRASEQNNERNTSQLDDSGVAGAGAMGEEDSSLAMAREFLSRLVSKEIMYCVIRAGSELIELLFRALITSHFRFFCFALSNVSYSCWHASSSCVCFCFEWLE